VITFSLFASKPVYSMRRFKVFNRRDSDPQIRLGAPVCIRNNKRSPYPGREGVIIAINPSDVRGEYLVQFDDGMCFRYQASEFSFDSLHRLIPTQ
jgi:hypothetical protein